MRAEDPIANRRTPARTSHGTSSGVSPPPASTSSATRGSRVGPGDQLVDPVGQTTGGPGRDHRLQPRQPADVAPGVLGVQRLVEAVEQPRHPAQLGAHLGAALAVDLQVAVEEAEGQAAGPQLQERGPEVHQPAVGQSRSGAAQHDVHGQVGLAYDGRDRPPAPGSGTPASGSIREQQPVGPARSRRLGVAGVQHDDVEVGALAEPPLALGSQWSS